MQSRIDLIQIYGEIQCHGFHSGTFACSGGEFRLTAGRLIPSNKAGYLKLARDYWEKEYRDHEKVIDIAMNDKYIAVVTNENRVQLFDHGGKVLQDDPVAFNRETIQHVALRDDEMLVASTEAVYTCQNGLVVRRFRWEGGRWACFNQFSDAARRPFIFDNSFTTWKWYQWPRRFYSGELNEGLRPMVRRKYDEGDRGLLFFLNEDQQSIEVRSLKLRRLIRRISMSGIDSIKDDRENLKKVEKVWSDGSCIFVVYQRDDQIWKGSFGHLTHPGEMNFLESTSL